MAHPNVFVFAGHGDETIKPFKSRELVPPGITLVALAQCGQSMTLQISRDVLVGMLANEKTLFEDPVGNKSAIEAAFNAIPIRVYQPGDMLPDLVYMSLGDATPPKQTATAPSYTVYTKSGVYALQDLTFPVQPEWAFDDRKDLIHTPTGATFAPRFEFLRYAKMAEGKDPALAKSMYEGAVFPDAETIDAAVTGVLDRTPIGEVFDALGPGVYYWPICRGGTQTGSEEKKAKQVRPASAKQQRETTQGRKDGGRIRRKTARRRTSRHPRRNRFL